MNTDKVAYVRQTVFTNNAAAVAAGALKPTLVVTAAREEAPIRTIAHLSEALDRAMLSDLDSLTKFIDEQLRLGVLLEEEDQIINGDGTAPNISGFLDQTGLETQAKGADPTPDAIHKAITKIRVVFGEPDGVVIHPNDWEQIARCCERPTVSTSGRNPPTRAAPHLGAEGGRLARHHRRHRSRRSLRHRL